MASYGSIFEFLFDSQNGAEIRIIISQRDYVGEVYRRSLGRAPVLRRDNNDHIFGTSLEIYAECVEDGEYATLYSSSAYDHMVEVYKDDTPLWTGFVSPELYSEPDIAPPYDVQIIATDGLGELKNYEFKNPGTSSVWSHIRHMLKHTGVDFQYNIVSALSYSADGEQSSESELLDFLVSLDHEVGNSCYDVLQRLLAGMNMSITQHLGRWLLFRETDLMSLSSSDGIEAYDGNGYSKIIPVASFGSADNNEWWPVGQLSSVIEPANNRIVLESPNHYRNNVLNASEWAMANGAYLERDGGVYILPDEGSNISQVIDFNNIEVGYRLALRVRARNVGSGDEDQALGIMIKIDGRSYSGSGQYWLVQTASSDRGVAAYQWRNAEGTILSELAVPSDSNTDADAQDVDIILPLYVYDMRSYIYATSVEITVFNPAGIHDIHVYDVALGKYDQFSGYQADVLIDNNAREEASTVGLSLTAGDTIPASGHVFMSGIPMLPDGSAVITEWATRGVATRDYISFMAYDYSRAIALPKMSYRGILNVPPTSAIPTLFVRDGMFYLPRTYSYNLVDDEVEIDMISISAADVLLSDVIITEIAESEGRMPAGSSGGSGGGSGGNGGESSVSILNSWDDYSGLADQVLGANLGVELNDRLWEIENAGWGDSIEDIEGIINDMTDRLVILEDLADMFRWVEDEDGTLRIETDYDLYSKKTLGSGGKGVAGSTAGLGIMGVILNGSIITDEDDDRLVTLPDYPSTVSELTDSDDYVRLEDLDGLIDADIAGIEERLSVVEAVLPTLEGHVDALNGSVDALNEEYRSLSDAVAGVDSDIEAIEGRTGLIEESILELQAEDERLMEILSSIGAMADMFRWVEDEDGTLRIETDYDLYSKKTLGSGGKGVAGTGGIAPDLSAYATTEWVNDNFLSLEGGHVEDVLSAGEFYTAGDATVEGTLYADGTLTALNINVLDITIDAHITLNEDSTLTGSVYTDEFTINGNVVCDNVTIASLKCTDELYATYVEIDTLLVYEGGITLGASSMYGDYGTLTINCQELNVTGQIRSETIDDIYDRLGQLEALL